MTLEPRKKSNNPYKFLTRFIKAKKGQKTQTIRSERGDITTESIDTHRQ